MKISKLSVCGVLSFIVFLLCLLFKYNGWYFQFWVIRIVYIIFFITGLAIFFRPRNRLFTWITSSVFVIILILIPISIALGGIFFVGIVLAVILSPVVGPTFHAKQGDYVVQRPYQGFLGPAYRYELVEQRGIFERKIFIFQADTTRIGSFKFDPITQKLSLNNGKQVIYSKDHIN